jgi:hypothetical protein
MQATAILTNVAILLVAAAVWADMRHGERVTIAGRTMLVMACSFALISSAVQLFLQ